MSFECTSCSFLHNMQAVCRFTNTLQLLLHESALPGLKDWHTYFAFGFWAKMYLNEIKDKPVFRITKAPAAFSRTVFMFVCSQATHHRLRALWAMESLASTRAYRKTRVSEREIKNQRYVLDEITILMTPPFRHVSVLQRLMRSTVSYCWKSPLTKPSHKSGSSAWIDRPAAAMYLSPFTQIKSRW